jgi:microcompartment protein CcmK/EutM
MFLARVVGTVVSTQNTDRIDRGRYLLVQPADESGSGSGTPMIALDAIQANRDQLVLVTQGSSCRQLPETRDTAVDALIVGIVDTVDVAGSDGGYRAS